MPMHGCFDGCDSWSGDWKYELVAFCEGGAVVFHGNTIKDVIYKFETIYNRKGFKIDIFNNQGNIVKVIKKTDR